MTGSMDSGQRARRLVAIRLLLVAVATCGIALAVGFVWMMAAATMGVPLLGVAGIFLVTGLIVGGLAGFQFRDRSVWVGAAAGVGALVFLLWQSVELVWGGRYKPSIVAIALYSGLTAIAATFSSVITNLAAKRLGARSQARTDPEHHP